MTKATFLKTAFSYTHNCCCPGSTTVTFSDAFLREKAPECESDGGRCMSKHHNLSIFASSAPISLTVCLPWQRLFSDQLGVSLASAPSLYTAHSGCTCQPNRPVPVALRGRESQDGWRMQGRKEKAKNGKKFFTQWE